MVQQIILAVYVLLVVSGTVLMIVSECKDSWVDLPVEKMGMMLFIELVLCIGAFLLGLTYVLLSKEYWWLVLMALPIVAGQVTAQVKR